MTILVARENAHGGWSKVGKVQFTKDGQQVVRRPASVRPGTLESLWAAQSAKYFAAEPAAASLDFEHGTIKMRVTKI